MWVVTDFRFRDSALIDAARMNTSYKTNAYFPQNQHARTNRIVANDSTNSPHCVSAPPLRRLSGTVLADE
jgi:hypothetical protein